MYKHSLLLQKVYSNVQATPNKVALIVNGEETTYAVLWTNIKKAAAYLLSKGYRAHDVVPIKGVKEARFIWMYFGAHMVGVSNELFDPELDVKTLEYTAEDVLAMDPFEGEVEGLSETDVIEILHTTGTTSKPKAVCLSNYNVFWAAKNTSDFVQNDQDDIEMVVMPICHAFGLRRMVLTIMNGATAVLLPNFANVQLLIKTIDKYHITTWGMAPSAWQYVRKISGTRISKYADQVRHIEFGTAAMPMAGKQDILQLLPNTRICHNYGLTESNRSCMIEYHDTEHLTSVGRPIADNVEVRVIDGEICVHGNQTMVGYLDEGDNNTAFVDGFFRTGDCGYISEDGYIYLTGRAKEMINAGGKKVSPIEVEDAITTLGVGDCIVVGVPHELLGECIKAYILKGSTDLTLEQIDEKMKNSVPFFKCPTYYEWIDEIPVNSLGKKQRRALTEKK